MRRRRYYVSGLFLVATAFGIGHVAGCTGSDPLPDDDDTRADAAASTDSPTTNPESDGGGGGDAGLVTLTLAPSRPRVRRGTTASIDITVDRAGVTGALPLTVKGLPTGVSVATATVPAGASATKLAITATGDAVSGLAPIEITVPGGAPLLTTLVVAGAAGSLDESFDDDGLFLDTSTSTNIYFAVAVQPDGKILVAGSTNAAGGTWIVKRFEPNGAPDTAFNTAAATALPTSGAARGIAVDPKTNRIVIVGDSMAVNMQGTLVRLNTNGAIDQSFANAGIMVNDSVNHGSGSRGRAALVLPDSSILMAGRKEGAPTATIEHFTAGGQPALSGFTVYNGPDNSELNALVALPAAGAFPGGFLGGGTFLAASPDEPLLVRVLANGSGDTTFGPGGVQSLATGGCRGYGLGLARDGDAVIVGDDQTAPVPCASRVAASGDGGVRFTVRPGSSSSAAFYAAVGATATSAVYAGGVLSGSQEGAAIVERRFVDAGLDTTFGTGGEIRFEDTVSVPDAFRYTIRALATSSDGQLLIAGSRTGSVATGAFIARVWE